VSPLVAVLLAWSLFVSPPVVLVVLSMRLAGFRRDRPRRWFGIPYWDSYRLLSSQFYVPEGRAWVWLLRVAVGAAFICELAGAAMLTHPR
jgi:hypothetical protein